MGCSEQIKFTLAVCLKVDYHYSEEVGVSCPPLAGTF